MPNMPPHLYDKNASGYKKPEPSAGEGCAFLIGFPIALLMISPDVFFALLGFVIFAGALVVLSRGR